MGKKGTLTVRVISDTKSAEAGLDRFATKVDSTGDRMVSAGKKMTMFATVPIVGAMTLATNAASELEQAVGGTEAVFGDAAETIEDFAKSSAQDAGLSERAFREATTSIGGQLKRMTGDVDFAAEKSIELTQVAADLAATYGGTTAEAVQALGAAFRGEADPAERFNLNLKISEVQAKAVEMGLAATTSEVDENARAQATLALIMDQSADAQGQFAREAGTTAGQLQIARAEIEDAAAELGENLLPIVSKVAGGVADLASAFGDLPEPVQNGVLVLGGILAAAGPVTTALGGLMNGSRKAADMFTTLRLRGMYLKDSLGGTSGLVGVLGVAGGALAAFTIALQGHARKAAESRQRTDELVASIKELGETDGPREWLNGLVEDSDLLRAAMAEAGLTVDDLAVALSEGGPAFDSFSDSLMATIDLSESGAEVWIPKLRDEVNGLRSEYEAAGPKLDELNTVQAELGDTADSTADSTEDMGDAMSDAETEAKSLDEAVRKLKEGFDTLNGAQISVDEAAIAVAEDFARLTESLEENGTTLDQNTEQGRANYAQLLDTIQAAQDHAAAVYEETGSVDAATDALNDHVDQLRRDMEQAGFTEDQIKALIDRYNLTPREISTSVRLLGAEDAERALTDLTRSRTATISAIVSAVGQEGRAIIAGSNHGGGRVSPHTPYLVGRPGADELFWPDQAGTVYSGIQTDQMLGRTPSAGAASGASGGAAAGSGIVVNITGGTYLGTNQADLKRELVALLNEAAQQGIR